MKNSSCVLVSELLKESRLREDGVLKNFCLLSNSFEGVKKDIEAIKGNYDFVIMFGCDKSLKDCVRLECSAEKDGVKCETRLDVKLLSETLVHDGVENVISETPTQYLCNEAYWCALQKFEGKAVFVHIPTLKNIDENFISKMKELELWHPGWYI